MRFEAMFALALGCSTMCCVGSTRTESNSCGACPIGQACDAENVCRLLCNQPQDCDAGSTCLNGFCRASTSSTACASDKECDDGNLCNGTETCSDDGTCETGPVPDCAALADTNLSSCMEPACEPDIGCTLVPVDGGDCDDDGDLCTLGTCDNGVCVETPKVCVDSDPCTHDRCEAGVCIFPAKGDFEACNAEDDTSAPHVCVEGQCIGGKIQTFTKSLDPNELCDPGIRTAVDLDYAEGSFWVLGNQYRENYWCGACDGGNGLCVAQVQNQVAVRQVTGTYSIDYESGSSINGFGKAMAAGYAVGSTLEPPLVNPPYMIFGWVNGSGSFEWSPAGHAWRTDLGPSYIDAGPLTAVGGVCLGPCGPGQRPDDVWFAGTIKGSSDALVVHCQNHTSCSAGTNCCSDNLIAASNTSPTAVLPVTDGGQEPSYSGGLLLTPTGSGGTSRYYDNGINGNFVLLDAVANITLNGLVQRSEPETLVYGSGGFLQSCVRTVGDDDWSCSEVTGLGNQQEHQFVDAVTRADGTVVMISIHAVGDELTNYLWVLHAGRDSTEPSNWIEHVLQGGISASCNGSCPDERLVVAIETDGTQVLILGNNPTTGGMTLWWFE